MSRFAGMFQRSARQLRCKLLRAGLQVHPATIERAKRLTGKSRRRVSSGKLSVVIPVYNVSQYIEPLLNSIISQSYRDIEIIIVDDGSTDRTFEIVRAYSRRDPRINLHARAHGGNGRARNFGVQQSTGLYLTFADGDDIVPKDAYANMIAVLAKGQSDFVVGGYGRFRSGKKAAVRLSSKLHAENRRGIRPKDFPEISDNVFLWNKIYRLDFWSKAIGSIPEGILYEDQEVAAKAYLSASRIDVVAETVYWWRVREDGSSITQGKHEIADLRDRLSVANIVTNLHLARYDPAMYRTWILRLFGSDLVPYMEIAPDSNDDYWNELVNGVKELLRPVGKVDQAALDPQVKVMLFLIAKGDRGNLLRLVVDRQENGTESPIEVVGDSLVARPNFIDQSDQIAGDLSSLDLSVRRDSLRPILVVDRIAQDTVANNFIIRGYAYVSGIDSKENGVETELSYESPDGDVVLPKVSSTDPSIDVHSNDRFNSYSAARFEVRLASVPPRLCATLKVSKFEWSTSLDLRTIVADEKFDASAPHVTSVDLVPSGFTITVNAGEDSIDGLVFGLFTTSNQILPSAAVVEAGGVALTLHFHGEQSRFGFPAGGPVSGSYSLRQASSNNGLSASSPSVQVSFAATMELPERFDTDKFNIRPIRTASGKFALKLSAPLAVLEESRRGQEILRKRMSNSSLGLRQGVFFESFGGGSCTDNPRSLSDELYRQGFDQTIYWSVNDSSVDVPDYAVPLYRGSSDWYEYLMHTATIVNNNNFPSFYRKASGQNYIQTWHGTPLKKIGLDAPHHNIPASYRTLMAREASYWDTLLLQNSFSEDIFPSALGYRGDLLFEGYPRNDPLTGDDSIFRRELVRQRLGFGPDDVVILYAPTWRDNFRDEQNRSTDSSLLETEKLRQILGGAFSVMIRAHHNVSGSIARKDGSFLNVSGYPQVNDLYLASDLLVSDYSSCIFDYSTLGKPIVLFAPDLEEYENRTRGFYTDYHGFGPGPIVHDTSSLASAILALGTSFDREEMARFQTRFTPKDDGQSAARVVRSLFT